MQQNCVQAMQTYCTTSSTLHRLLQQVLHGTQTQTAAVWLLQLRLTTGDFRSARTYIALSVNQVSDHCYDD